MNKKLNVIEKDHIDCFKLMTEKIMKGYFYRTNCPKCGNGKCQTTGRKVSCKKTPNKVEVKCDKCWNLFWIESPDWWG